MTELPLFLPQCPLCKSVGTIVELGQCCKVMARPEAQAERHARSAERMHLVGALGEGVQNSTPAKLESGGSLSTNRL